MKIKNIIIIFIASIFVLILLSNTVLASEITITPNTEKVEKGEIFKFYINSNNLDIAALTMQMYFDSTKMEYIKENENTNLLENSILYTWVDENGGKQRKQTEQIIELKFKAKEAGTANISANREFYKSNGEDIKIQYGEGNVQIEELDTTQEEQEIQSNNNISSDNAYLEILRLDKEGITPSFNKEITEYYITVDSTVNNLQITAIPENIEANVEIKGNNNLVNGINKIEIIVTSKDGSKKKIYNINVTKTSNIAASNTNLETLAIENVTLFPEFYENILNYKAEVSNETKSLNILAIPQSISAQVVIEGNTNLKEGKNIVNVKVIAENKISEKNYIIEVYKRNSNEEVEALEEQEIKIEKANELIEEKEQNQEEAQQLEYEINTQNNDNDKNNNIIIIIITIVIILGSITAFIIYRKKKNYND